MGPPVRAGDAPCASSGSTDRASALRGCLIWVVTTAPRSMAAMATLKNEAIVWVRVVIEVISLRGPSFQGSHRPSARPVDPCIPRGILPSRIWSADMQRPYREQRLGGPGESPPSSKRPVGAEAREYRSRQGVTRKPGEKL